LSKDYHFQKSIYQSKASVIVSIAGLYCQWEEIEKYLEIRFLALTVASQKVSNRIG